MNWPSLSAECSQAIAEVLRDAVHLKPKDLLEHTAQQLQKRSGLDPDAFAAHFEECRRRPRTYVLEDWCPAGQDPMKWVPMRYNDDTILRTLRIKAGDLAADVFSELLVEDTRPFLDRFTVAFPEFQYMKGSPEECLVFQYMRAIYIGCSRCPEILPQGLDDADPQLAFRCEAFIEFARGQLFEIAVQDDDALEAIVVCCMLRALGSHTGFQQRFGGGLARPMEAVMYAVEHNIEALPSFHRLSEHYRELILAVSQALFPLDMLVTSEVVPTHFQRIKERVAPKENGMAFYMAVAAVEYMVQYRNVLIVNEVVDLLRLGIQSLTTIEKYNVLRSYELYLKKRAERHSWRLVKDDFAQRAAIRLCCFVGREDDDAWTEMLNIMDTLADDDKEVLSTELGHKDGITESPVYVLVGVAAFLAQAAANDQLTVQPALHLLTKILEDAALSFDSNGNLGCVSLHMERLAVMAREYRPGKSVPFEDLPFTFQEVDANEIIVHVGSEP